ncbi:hypothetical protein E2I00_015097, partial [Balaenoptera physalus]
QDCQESPKSKQSKDSVLLTPTLYRSFCLNVDTLDGHTPYVYHNGLGGYFMSSVVEKEEHLTGIIIIGHTALRQGTHPVICQELPPNFNADEIHPDHKQKMLFNKGIVVEVSINRYKHMTFHHATLATQIIEGGKILKGANPGPGASKQLDPLLRVGTRYPVCYSLYGKDYIPNGTNSCPNQLLQGWALKRLGWKWSEFAYQTLSMVDTAILPSMVGIICSMGLVGNILIVFTIIRSRKKTIPDVYICNLAVADLVHIMGMPFLIHQWARGGEWVFGGPLCTIITSLDTCNQFACSAIMTVMSVDSWRTRYKTICINLGLWAASFILASPVWVYLKVIRFKDSVESCTFDLTSPDNVLW